MQYIPSSTCDCLHSYIIVVDLKFMLLSYHVSGYFYIKNNSCKTYSRFLLVCKFFSMVDCYNMDKHLECSYHLIYYQVSGELGITGCRHLPQWVWTCIHACSLIIIFFFTCKTFCHWEVSNCVHSSMCLTVLSTIANILADVLFLRVLSWMLFTSLLCSFSLLHWKNSWVTSTTFLGCQLHQCDQGMLSNELRSLLH